MPTIHSVDELRARVSDVMTGVRRDLEALVRIQSVSADPARASEVRRSAEATADLLRAEGLDVQIVSATWARRPSSPTSRVRPAPVPSCCTPITMCSPKAITRSGGLAAVRADRAGRSAVWARRR